MAAKFEISKDHAGKVSLPPQGPERRDHRRQSGVRDEGQRREGHRGDQDTRTRCHGRRPQRVTRSASFRSACCVRQAERRD